MNMRDRSTTACDSFDFHTGYLVGLTSVYPFGGCAYSILPVHSSSQNAEMFVDVLRGHWRCKSKMISNRRLKIEK